MIDYQLPNKCYKLNSISILRTSSAYFKQRKYFRSSCVTILLSLLLISCAASGNRPPQILNLQDHQLVTNQNFQVDITAFDQDNDFIEFDFNLSPPPPTPTSTSGGVPTLQKVSEYSAVFNWTPGNADVGVYALTIIVTDEAGQQVRETANLRVVDSGIGLAQWGRFVEPVGEAAVLNLSETPCFETAVEVQADQLAPEELSVQLIPPSPSSATLVSDGIKKYRLNWCPQPIELSNQINFPFILRATNARNQATIDKRFLVRVRADNNNASCPGAPPTITHQSAAEYRGVENIVVQAQVTDDLGVKSAPTLFYQIIMNTINDAQPSGSQPSVDQWNSVVMNSSNQGQEDVWVATLPAPRGTEGATVFYKFLVSDDDDPNGPNCDHSVESEVFRLSYFWDESTGMIGNELCEPCVADIQCGGLNDSCLVANTSLGGVCGRACSYEQTCPNDYTCQEVISIDGVSRSQCISETVCGVSCLADQFEAISAAEPSNNNEGQATTLSPGTYEQLSICLGDEDFYQVMVPAGQSLVARIDFEHSSGDLDMKARDSDPNSTLPQSNSVSLTDVEEVVLSCVPVDTNALIKVFGHDGAQNQYNMSISVAQLPCQTSCENDQYDFASSGNETTFQATWAEPNMTYEARICPQDVDIYGFTLQANSRIEIKLEHDPNEGSLNIDVLDENNIILATLNANREIELLEFTAPAAGEYYVKIFSVSAMGNVAYQLLVRGGESLCYETNDCGEGLYCDGSGLCAPNSCDLSCESGHTCVSPIAGIIPINRDGICAPACSFDLDCRSNENCKAFENFTNRCAPTGFNPVAGNCSSFADCGGNMVCLPAPGGYCAAAGCFSESDCAPDTLCETIDGIPACLKRCNQDSDCGRPDLSCQTLSNGRVCAP